MSAIVQDQVNDGRALREVEAQAGLELINSNREQNIPVDS